MSQAKLVLWLSLAASTSPVTASAVSGQQGIPTVAVREELRISSDDPAPGMLLTAIEDLTVLPDGRIVTAHFRESVVRVFDPNGRLLTVIGRPGQGPGEFRNAWRVGWVGDRIWVNEGGGRYSLFDTRT